MVQVNVNVSRLNLIVHLFSSVLSFYPRQGLVFYLNHLFWKFCFIQLFCCNVSLPRLKLFLNHNVIADEGLYSALSFVFITERPVLPIKNTSSRAEFSFWFALICSNLKDISVAVTLIDVLIPSD